MKAFEEAFAAYCGVPHALAVTSATAGLQLALLAAFLAVKFLLTKTAFLILLLSAGVVFLFTRLRASPRKLFHSPVV